uniref:Leucine rich repeat protein n=1 Tax=Pithovirus LCPAC001 TaxID=2506585 RepID=A0A481Z4P2_9VIRU|nr:MAG: hypothetical protein LCPAC001_01200 [Pithovirus LCPAC001]
MLLNQRIKFWLKDTTQELDISNLELIEWPKQLVGKENLIKKLDFSRNKLTSLPNNLTNLETLMCSNNKLTSLPNNLTKLEILDCSSNKLTSLPNNLTNLKILVCFRNKLTSLPNDLTKLKELYCWNNKLFSNKLEKWKNIWPISIRHQYILRTEGIKLVVKVLKNRLYLPSLNELHYELIWSPNHPGKFFTLLPRVGQWKQ